MINFREILKESLIRKRIRPGQLGSALGVTPGHASNMIKGNVKPPNFEMCQKICKVLGLNDMDEILFFKSVWIERMDSNNKQFLNYLTEKGEITEKMKVFFENEDLRLLSIMKQLLLINEDKRQIFIDVINSILKMTSD